MSTINDTHNNDMQDDANKNPEQLEREVDQARERLGNTTNELSDRLSPNELINQAIDMVREHGGEFGSNLGSQIKNNPMPMILTSVGLSWMMMCGKNGPTQPYETQSTSTNKGGRNFKDTLGDTAAKSRDKAEAVGDRVHDATENMKASAQTAQESLAQFYREQPLLAGSLGVAIGAALAALIPSTEFEDEKLGEVRDRSVDTVKSKVEEKYDEVRESVQSE